MVVGIECIRKPASSEAVLISTMVELRSVRQLGIIIAKSLYVVHECSICIIHNVPDCEILASMS